MDSDKPARRPIQPVILAGGAGTRLWPLSTAGSPKHLLKLVGDRTLFEETLERVAGAPFAAPMVVANIRQEAALRRLAPDATLLLEPVKRDSGPAIALAASEADAESLLLVLPSDHHVEDPGAFLAAVEVAAEAAAQGAIVTFGITPDRPATGFGYIAAEPGEGARPVERFIEKPPLAEAEAMIAAGGHYWNAGIFLASAARWRAAFAEHAPPMLDAARAAHRAAVRDGQSVRVDAAAFARTPAQSID